MAGSLDPAKKVTTAACPARLGWRAALLFYASFVGGVVLATWPLATAPATLWPQHHDPALWTWVMGSMVRRLAADPLRLLRPLALFDGTAYYPYGLTLAFSEPLLAPAVLGAPGFLWGSPVLTYNLLVLLLWPLNGVAMAWAAHELTGSRRAAWLAGVVFCLSPYFTRYQVEFQMLPAAAIPVALVGWLRWLETQRARWLGSALGGVAIQGLTSWYYTILLGLGLATVTVAYACLRWRGWRGRALAGLAGGAATVAALLAPLAWPYVVLRRELGFERSLDEVVSHYADLFSFVEAGGRSLLYRWQLTGGIPETSAFVGFAVLALAAVSASWMRGDPGLPPRAVPVARALRLALLVALVVTAVGLAWGPRARWVGPVRLHLRAAAGMWAMLACAAGILLLRGWAAARSRASRDLTPGERVRVLLLLAGVGLVLALGPELHVGGRDAGAGPYLSLYRWLLPLHAMRTTIRAAVLVVAALGMLGALGWRWTEIALARRPAATRALYALLCVALAAEYAMRPPRYVEVPRARPVDAALAADPADVAVLEWPTYAASADTEAMFRSLAHGKRVVNGHSGFLPGSLHYLAKLLSDVRPPFPSPEAMREVRKLLPLRYLVVRRGHPDFAPAWRQPWLDLRAGPPPGLRFRGTYGSDDLYELVPVPERAVRAERWASFDFLRAHPVLGLTLGPVTPSEERDQRVTVSLNGEPLRTLPLADRTTARIPLAGPLHRAAANIVALEYSYVPRDPARDPRYRIGATGATCPVDLRVRSVGQVEGSGDSIQVDGDERSPDRRGYNLVALTPGGALLGRGTFDTYLDPTASGRLAAWIRALPVGTIVAGAVRDEASSRLDAEAVAALRELGVAADLRGRFRASHAFVGVKGAAPGTAAERTGPGPVELEIGHPGEKPGFELIEVRLTDT